MESDLIINILSFVMNTKKTSLKFEQILFLKSPDNVVVLCLRKIFVHSELPADYLVCVSLMSLLLPSR